MTIEFIDKAGKKYSLPKYDPDGYEYIYVVREYMEMDDGDNSYEQVFGTIVTDKETGTETVTGDFIMEYDKDAGDVIKKARPAGNTYLYNDGTLSNRATGSGSATVVKEWNADAYQANLDQYAVKMTLYQSTRRPRRGGRRLRRPSHRPGRSPGSPAPLRIESYLPYRSILFFPFSPLTVLGPAGPAEVPSPESRRRSPLWAGCPLPRRNGWRGFPHPPQNLPWPGGCLPPT